jgi:hypothetical protein
MIFQKTLCCRKTHFAIGMAIASCLLGACSSKDLAVDQNELTTTQNQATATVAKRGLSEEEDQLRAKQVADISYDLQLNIAQSRTHFYGQAKIKFRLTDRRQSDTLRIDFSGGKILELQVNGLGLQPKYNGQFIEIPIATFEGGTDKEQNILVNFEHRYNQDGRGLSTFLDPVDKKTYLYSRRCPQFS